MTPEDRTLLQATHDAVIDMTRMCHGHEKTLYGNGQPGVTQQVQVLSTRQAECPARNAATNSGRSVTIASLSLLVSSVVLLWAVFGK